MFELTCLDSYGESVTHLTQWDIDQSLIIENTGLTHAPLFHFCNKNSTEALVVTSSINNGIITVKVPNSLLQESFPIIAYMYVYSTATAAKTIETIRIPVRPRIKPSEYKYVENIDVVSAEGIKQEILDKVNELSQNTNRQLSDWENTQLNHRNTWEQEQKNNFDELVKRVSDGSPKGFFVDESELTGKPAGAYVNSTNGYLYHWDGTTLSDAICQYQSTGIADGSVTYEMLADTLKYMAVEDNRIFDTVELANTYLLSDNAKSGQIIKILEDGVYQVYIIQLDSNSENGFKLSPINAEITAMDVPYNHGTGNNTVDNVKTALDSLYSEIESLSASLSLSADKITYSKDENIKSVKAALDNIYTLINDNLASSLDFDEVSSQLSLLSYGGINIGEAIKIAASGISNITVDTIVETDEDGNQVYYLAIYDEDGKELTKCLLPATGGGGSGSAYLVRLINLMGALRYTVASNQQHSIGVLYMETLGGESTNVEGSLEVSYKLASDENYTLIGTYNIGCATSKDDTDKAFYIDVTKYLTVGETTNFKFVVTGGESAQTKTVTYSITSAEIGISTNTAFNKAFTGNFSFLYKCIGRGLSKTVHFYIDDIVYDTVDVGVSHNVQLSEPINLIDKYSYGSHDFKVYFTTSDGVKSNEIHYTIMYDDKSSTNPIIAIANNKEKITYGETISVDYAVYTPNKETTDELNIRLYTIEADNSQKEYVSSVMSNVLNETFHTWTCNTYPSKGTVYIEFSSGNITKTISMTISETEGGYNIEPIATNLVFSFSPSGKSNNDNNKEIISCDYTDVNGIKTTIPCTFENMNWVSDGYVSTNYGTALRLFGSDIMTVNLPIFSSSYTDKDGKTVTFNGSPSGIGRTIEITLNIHEVTNRNATVLSCMSDGHAGIKITPQSVCLLSATGSNLETDSTGFITNEESVCCAYIKDEEKIRISFVLSSVKQDNKQCLVIYINGEVANSIPYDAEELFLQNMPITIGDSSCITDIYDIKIYDRELSESEIRTNWYASQDTINERISMYEFDNVLDDREAINYEKVKTKYPCLLFIGSFSPYKGAKTKGAWILTKPNGEGGYTTEFSLTDKLNGEYVCTSDVQGTTSQKFMRKNYKVGLAKLSEDGTSVSKVEYSINKDGIGESTLCWKADYMSTDHANTFNANLVDEILTTIAPTETQIANPKIQNAINGFRCLLFNQLDDNSPILFAGDGCLNNDKGNSKSFGLKVDSDSGNVTTRQKYEFLNNTADICHFKTDKFQHKTNGVADIYNALESTYPDQGDLEDAGLTPNWDYVQVLFTWVCQRANFWDADDTTITSYTYNGVTYNTERAYKKAIFINEFETHFNKNHALIYYLFLEFVALVDNRAKNMFIQCDDVTVEKIYNTSGQIININDCIDTDGNVDINTIDWTGKSSFAKWKVSPYDLDSCYSAENNGYLRVPYYADWDYELNGTKQFNGYDSRLWLMFEEAFADDIKAMAQTLASQELLCYDKFYDAHIIKNAKTMCPVVVNKDMVYKYEETWTDGYYDYSESTTNPTWIQTNMYKYLHRGQRTLQKESYIYNRSHMFYSKYVTTQFVKNQISFRVGASNGISVNDADLTLTANIALFIGVGYGDTGNGKATTNGKIMPNTPTTLHASTRVGRSDTIYLYSGTDLIDIGDISIFEPYEIQLQRAIKIKNLKIGDIARTNTSLSSIDLSNCVLLQNLNICGCTALVGTLDVSTNGLIEVIDARNSGIDFVKFPVGGNLKELHLPRIKTLSILNHTRMESFDCQGYDNLTQLRIENTPNIPSYEILLNYMSQLTSGIRLVGIEWSLEDSTLLEMLVSDDAKGKYITSAGTLSGDSNAYPYISGTIHIERINQNLLNTLNAAYPYLTIDYSILTHTVKFYNNDILYNVQEIDNGKSAKSPDIPSKSNTTQWKYTFASWDTDYKNIREDLVINAIYSSELQKYKVEFYNNILNTTPLCEFENIDYGASVTYTGEEVSNGENSIFIGWESNGNVNDFNTIIINDTFCSIDSNGIAQTITFYAKQELIQMPNRNVLSLSELSYSEIKAVSNMIKSGGDSTWSVQKIESENQYILINNSTNVSIILSIGDEINIKLSNGQIHTMQIYDFLHDIDENGNPIGLTLGSGKKTLGANKTSISSSIGYSHCFNYTLSGHTYINNDERYSDSDTTYDNSFYDINGNIILIKTKKSTIDSTIYKVTDEEATKGYVELVINDFTYLESIKVSNPNNTEKIWWFDYRGYYCGYDTSSLSKPSWYYSDYKENEYKICKAIYVNGYEYDTDTNTNYSEFIKLSNTIIDASNFGGMEVDISQGYIKYFRRFAYSSVNTSEITKGVIIKIPVEKESTVQILHRGANGTSALGGYKYSSIRKYFINTIDNFMPIGLLNIIIPAKKKYLKGFIDINTNTIIDKFWLFSYSEVSSVSSYNKNIIDNDLDKNHNYYEDEGTLYSIFADNESRKKIKYNGDATIWHLRTPYYVTDDYYSSYYSKYYSVNSLGQASINSSGDILSIVIGLSI